MVRSQKRVFIEALILAIVLFGIGITLGLFIESWRAEALTELYTQSEINLLDLKTQTQAYDTLTINCEEAVRQTEEFADRIYDEARSMERFEEAQRLSESLVIQHKKYDLLRTSLWLNAIKIKEKCGTNSYDTLVYFYDYQEPTLNTKALQEVYSRILREIKEEKGSQVILLPIAGDIEAVSIEILKKHYGITTLPTVIINEQHLFSGTITREELSEKLSS